VFQLSFNFALGLCFSNFCLWPHNPFDDKIFLQNPQTTILYRTPFSVIMLHAKGWDYCATYFSKLYVLYLPFVMDRLMVYRGVTMMYVVRNLCSAFWLPKYLVFIAACLEIAAFLIRAHPRWLPDFSFCPPEGLLIKTKKKIMFVYCCVLSFCLFLLLW
jgi:hypothetical protein